jgi:hypothetical protein
VVSYEISIKDGTVNKEKHAHHPWTAKDEVKVKKPTSANIFHGRSVRVLVILGGKRG